MPASANRAASAAPNHVPGPGWPPEPLDPEPPDPGPAANPKAAVVDSGAAAAVVAESAGEPDPEAGGLLADPVPVLVGVPGVLAVEAGVVGPEVWDGLGVRDGPGVWDGLGVRDGLRVRDGPGVRDGPEDPMRPAGSLIELVGEVVTGRLRRVTVGVGVGVAVPAGHVNRNVGSGVALCDAPGPPRPGGGVGVWVGTGGWVGVRVRLGPSVGLSGGVDGAGRWLRDGKLVGTGG
jgi:hypothetical protein